MSEDYIRPFPGVIRIEPAGACNLRCSHCPTGTVAMARGIMRPELFARVLGEVKAHIDAVRVVVLYHGGEPLLNKHLWGWIREVKAAGVPFVKTVSNGMRLDDAAIAKLVDSGLDHIEISLDGLSDVESDFIRRDSEYATIVANVKRLIEHKDSVGAETPRIFIASTQFFTRGSDDDLGRDPSPPRHLVDEFSGEYAAGIAGFKCSWAMVWPHMETLEDIYETYSDPDDTEIRDRCDHVDSTVTIRWNGDVVACCFDLTSKFVLGNVLQDDLETIWNNRRFLGLRRSIATRKLIPLCANCKVVAPATYLTLKPAVAARLRAEAKAGSASPS